MNTPDDETDLTDELESADCLEDQLDLLLDDGGYEHVDCPDCIDGITKYGLTCEKCIGGVL